MANLPEKNITQVDEITSVPANSKLFVNANGEFKQASVNDVIKSATVVSDTVNNAINDAMQDSIDSHFKQATGSPILLTDTADGTLIDFKAYGRSTQKQYSGKNLANVKDKTSGTGNGITSSIANEVVTASGTSTGNGDIFISLSTNIVMESGTDYTISIQEITGTMPSYFTVYLYDDSTSIFSNYDTMSTSNLSVVFNLTDTIECSGVLFRISTNNTINGTFRLQIEKGTTKTDYEPYVGGTVSPSPDYPQAIKSVADGGWFDGELLQGGYSAANGLISSRNDYISNKNMIPCKQGDNITVVYDGESSMAHIFFYDENKNYISYVTMTTTNAPANAYYFNFSIYNASGISLANAKHITVTINGKYALIVKSKGKNSLQNTATTQTINGVTFTVNDNGSVTVKGTLTAVSAEITEIALTDYIPLEDNTKYILSGCPDGGSEDKFFVRVWTNNAYKQLATDIGNSTTFVTNFSEHVNYKAYICVRGLGVSYDTTFYPMIRKAEVTDDTYEPYKETVSYIPLDEPLRSNLDGIVTDEVSLTECKRKFGKFVLNGTENWYFTANANAYISLGGLLKPNGIVISDYYVVNRTKAENTILVNSTNVIIYDKRFATVDKWKAWLAENNVTLIYELAEPIKEKIEPVDIVTYDNVTYLTASDNAEMELEYPTSKVAGIASIGYSKGRKAEYEVELLKAQLLELQTAMVNSL